MPISFLITPLDILWKIIEDYGHDPKPIFDSVGLTFNSLKKSGERIPLSTMDSIWEKASQSLGDPCFGLKAAQYWHPSHLNALGYAWLASPTLKEALKRLERYWQIFGEGADIQIQDEKEGVKIIFCYTPDSAGGNARVDAILSCIMLMCRINYIKDLDPISVHLVQNAPDCKNKYNDFYNIDVTFNSKENCILLPYPEVIEPLAGGNQHLARLNDQIMINYLTTLEKKDILHQVKNAIVNRLPSGHISKDIVAQHLNMSTRSMQRKLKQQQTSFTLLLKKTRTELAKSYLKDPDNNLAEISFLLGFSQPSSFSRAFKRWSGLTPKEFKIKQ